MTLLLSQPQLKVIVYMNINLFFVLLHNPIERNVRSSSNVLYVTKHIRFKGMWLNEYQALTYIMV